MDTIFYNGKIHTQDEAYPSCTAIGVKNGVITALGNDDEVLSLASPATEKIDLAGRSLLPGLEDSHLHILFYAMQASMLDLAGARSLKEVQDLCASRVDWAKSNGKWVQGISFNQDAWNIKELPTRADLDAVSTEVPISIRRACYHVTVCNTKALEILGLMDNVDAAAKTNMGFFEDGTPNGTLKESLQNIITDAQPAPTKEEIKEMIITGCTHAATKGVTQIHSDDFMTMPGDDGETVMEAYRELSLEGKLPIRVYQQCLLWEDGSVERFLKRGHITGNNFGFYGIGPLKILADGSLGAHTAYMLNPYANDPENRGIPTYTDEEIYEVCSLAHDAGMQIAVHCIGDGAIEQTLKLFERLQLENPRPNCRHGIVHCQIMNSEQQDMFRKLNLIAYVQPVFIRSDMHIVDDCVVSDIAKQSYNWRRFKDLGVHQCGGSDCPVEAFDVLPNIEYAVTRQDIESKKVWYPENGVTLEEAIEMFTLEGAYTSFSENLRGSLTIGKYADLTVLEKDIFSVPATEIHNISVDFTMVQGKFAYRK